MTFRSDYHKIPQQRPPRIQQGQPHSIDWHDRQITIKTSRHQTAKIFMSRTHYRFEFNRTEQRTTAYKIHIAAAGLADLISELQDIPCQHVNDPKICNID